LPDYQESIRIAESLQELDGPTGSRTGWSIHGEPTVPGSRRSRSPRAMAWRTTWSTRATRPRRSSTSTRSSPGWSKAP